MRVTEENFEGREEPMVVIIDTLGAGQGGLTLAARLKQLGILTSIVERSERIGDN
jgi:cation diffusion facilitator CzcD-associated flavoprotein CzcO